MVISASSTNGARAVLAQPTTPVFDLAGAMDCATRWTRDGAGDSVLDVLRAVEAAQCDTLRGIQAQSRALARLAAIVADFGRDRLCNLAIVGDEFGDVDCVRAASDKLSIS